MYFNILTIFGLAFLLADVYPSLGKETNASRLKRGLPPLPPRFILGNKRATAPATISARPSHTPRSQLSARSSRIQVFAGNGSSLGYAKNSPITGINLDADPGQDLRIQTVTGEPFDIFFESPNSLSAPLYSEVLASSTLPRSSFRESSNVNRARRAAVSDKGLVRTAVWSIDSNTKELKAVYVDLNGAKSPMLAFDALENKLHFAGDIDIYNSDNDDFPVIPVRFYLSKV